MAKFKPETCYCISTFPFRALWAWRCPVWGRGRRDGGRFHLALGVLLGQGRDKRKEVRAKGRKEGRKDRGDKAARNSSTVQGPGELAAGWSRISTPFPTGQDSQDHSDSYRERERGHRATCDLASCSPPCAGASVPAGCRASSQASPKADGQPLPIQCSGRRGGSHSQTHQSQTQVQVALVFLALGWVTLFITFSVASAAQLLHLHT